MASLLKKVELYSTSNSDFFIYLLPFSYDWYKSEMGLLRREGEHSLGVRVREAQHVLMLMKRERKRGNKMEG